MENNSLTAKQGRHLDKELADCKVSGGDSTAIIQKYLDISNQDSAELKERCTSGGMVCVTYEDLIEANTHVAMDADLSQIRASEKLKDHDAARLVNYLNSNDLHFLKEKITTTDRILAAASDPTSWPFIFKGARAILTGVGGKEQLIAAGISSGANAGIQYGVHGEVKLSDVIGAGTVDIITAGKGYNPTVTWNAVGGYYSAKIRGDDPLMGTLPGKTGAPAGYAAGNILKVPMNKVLNPVSKQYEWVPIGIWTITKPVPQSIIPFVAGNIGDSAGSGFFNAGAEYYLKIMENTMIRNKSMIIMIYLPCAFFIMLFLMSLVFQVLGYWVSGGQDLLDLIKMNIYLYLKMGAIGVISGFILWIFDVK